jgi:7-cyano-7-deazaguanine reductase
MGEGKGRECPFRRVRFSADILTTIPYNTAMKKSSYEGKQDHIRNWKTPAIETFKNIYADRDYEIHMETSEFTCVCPKTGLPDFAQLVLTYVPDKLCLELKSFKEYLLAYRDQGIFHENAVNKILDDVVAAIKPRRARLEGLFSSRGGIQTTVTRDYSVKPNRKSS